MRNKIIVCTGLFVCILLGVILSTVISPSFSPITGFASQDLSLPPIPSAPGSPSISSCTDDKQNQDETDLDCGGICVQQGKKCAESKKCANNGDCLSDYCYVQTCRQKPKQQTTPLLTKESPPPKEETKTTIVVPLSLTPPPPRQGQTYTVAIQKKGSKFVFVPDKIDAFTGDKVILKNQDTVAHQPVALDRSFEGEKLGEGQSWTINLVTAGEITYHDDLHPSTSGLYNDFKGLISVRDWRGACDDKVQNLDETDLDCGGHCPPCDLNKICKTDNDCRLHVCKTNMCVAPQPVSCFDDLKNQDETDTDCGGSCQKKCSDGLVCRGATDCLSSFCSQSNKCLTPSCTDREKNQDESDIDCGGECTKCGEGSRCERESDCLTNVCNANRCDIATYDLQMVAKQFAFVPNTITVKKGSRVRLNVTSIDVPHGFSLPKYSLLRELQPHVPMLIEFIADKAGSFEFLCSVYCGSGHGAMRGTLIVEEEALPEAPAKETQQKSFGEEIIQKPKKAIGKIFLPFVLIFVLGIFGYYAYTVSMNKKTKKPSVAIDNLAEYIATMKKQGYNEEQIYSQLIRHGHEKEELERYLSPPAENIVQKIKRLRRLGNTKQKIMKDLISEGYTSIEIHEGLERSKW